jgi:hypothetical protein
VGSWVASGWNGNLRGTLIFKSTTMATALDWDGVDTLDGHASVHGVIDHDLAKMSLGSFQVDWMSIVSTNHFRAEWKSLGSSGLDIRCGTTQYLPHETSRSGVINALRTSSPKPGQPSRMP